MYVDDDDAQALKSKFIKCKSSLGLGLVLGFVLGLGLGLDLGLG